MNWPLYQSCLLTAMAGLALATPNVRGADPAFRKGWIVILHTNDLHGHLTSWRGWEGDLKGKSVGGLSRVAAAVRQVRTDVGKDRVLLLDAGDAFGGTMTADLTTGHAMVEGMNAVGYDAMCIGSHDLDFTAAGLSDCLKATHFPVLAANVFTSPGHALFTPPSLIRKVGDTQVGVFGLAYPNTELTIPRASTAGLVFESPAPAAKEAVAELKRQGAQVIIALTHLGLGADERLAQAVPGIDVIVGGHSHNRVRAAVQTGHTLIVQAGAFGSDVGRLDLHVDQSGRIVTQHHELMTLDHEVFGGDAEVKRVVEAQEAPFRAQLDERIAQAVTPIIRAQTLAGQERCTRDQQSAADSLFADILREETGSDFALLPGVGDGVAISPGPITAEALRNLLPHDGQVVTMKLTGAQIDDILEQAVENVLSVDPQKKVGGIIQVSGLQFSYDPRKPAFHRVTSVRTTKGDALEPAKVYAVATDSLLADGGDNDQAFSKGEQRQPGGSQYEMIKAWMTKTGKVSVPEDVRIVRAETSTSR